MSDGDPEAVTIVVVAHDPSWPEVFQSVTSEREPTPAGVDVLAIAQGDRAR